MSDKPVIGSIMFGPGGGATTHAPAPMVLFAPSEDRFPTSVAKKPPMPRSMRIGSSPDEDRRDAPPSAEIAALNERIALLEAGIAAVRAICAQSHRGSERAHAALSRIDQISRRAQYGERQ